MFATGHISIGYLLGKITKKKDASLNIPIVWALSLLPDIDLLIPGLLHMGPAHSVVTAMIIFAPIIYWKRREAIPYFLALASHSIFGDLVTNNRIMLLWPLSTKWISLRTPYYCKHTFNTYYELAFFALFLITFLVTKDHTRINDHPHAEIILTIPLAATALPLLLAYPLGTPKLLILPHLALLTIILATMIQKRASTIHANSPQR